MEPYVAYHIADKFGPFEGSTFFTGKADRVSLVGNRIWIVEGRDHPRRYALVASGIVSAVSEGPRPPEFQRTGQETGTNIEFTPEAHHRIDLTGQPWFSELLAEQQNFRFGVSKIINDVTISHLVHVWSEAAPDNLQSTLDDLDIIQKDPSTSPTTKKALIDARLGQGTFRRQLIARWDSTCAVTGCAVSAVLRASHIKPWRLSTNEERLDPANGFLLAAHLDALFDVGCISFDDTGEMILSTYLPLPDREILHLPRSLRKELTAAERDYLQRHRECVLKR